jgi:hypothetical protein
LHLRTTRGHGCPRSFGCGFAALGRIADLKSAALWKFQVAGICLCLAECNSAIQQIANLRYNGTRTVLTRRRAQCELLSRILIFRPERGLQSASACDNVANLLVSRWLGFRRGSDLTSRGP